MPFPGNRTESLSLSPGRSSSAPPGIATKTDTQFNYSSRPGLGPRCNIKLKSPQTQIEFKPEKENRTFVGTSGFFAVGFKLLGPTRNEMRRPVQHAFAVCGLTTL